MLKRSSLYGKTALVTGASKRIGREIALSLAEEGVRIVVHYNRSLKEAQALQRELTKSKATSWAVRADFKNGIECEALIGRVKTIAGALDIVINNASVFSESTLETLAFPDLIETIRVNAWTPLALAREFKRLFGKGHIINMLDTRISGFDRAHAGYILSKHLLASLTKLMAVEYAPSIMVNAVAPGLILPPRGKGPDYLERRVASNPLARHGNPRDIAQAVIYLLKTEFVTGQVIHIDGGRHLREAGWSSLKGANP